MRNVSSRLALVLLVLMAAVGVASEAEFSSSGSEDTLPPTPKPAESFSFSGSSSEKFASSTSAGGTPPTPVPPPTPMPPTPPPTPMPPTPPPTPMPPTTAPTPMPPTPAPIKYSPLYTVTLASNATGNAARDEIRAMLLNKFNVTTDKIAFTTSTGDFIKFMIIEDTNTTTAIAAMDKAAAGDAAEASALGFASVTRTTSAPSTTAAGSSSSGTPVPITTSAGASSAAASSTVATPTPVKTSPLYTVTLTSKATGATAREEVRDILAKKFGVTRDQIGFTSTNGTTVSFVIIVEDANTAKAIAALNKAAAGDKAEANTLGFASVSSSAPDDDKKKGLSRGVLAAIAIVAVLVVVLIAVVIFKATRPKTGTGQQMASLDEELSPSRQHLLNTDATRGTDGAV